jgi:long-chain acyl-CoA synthetase
LAAEQVLTAYLDANAERLGDRTALVCGDVRIGHEELRAAVRGLACGLVAAGVESGDCVLLALPAGPGFVQAFLAVGAAGAGAMLLDPQSKESELTFALGDCRPRVVVADGPGAERCRELASRLELEPTIVSLGEPPAGTIGLAELAALGGGARLPVESPDEHVLYQFSSGSTGRPKRVGRTRRHLWLETQMLVGSLDLSEDDAILCAIPLYHAYGLGSCVQASLGSGATLVIQESPQPFALKRGETLELIQREHVTVFPTVPYMVELLAEAPFDADLSGLRYCYTAGAALPAAAVEAFDARFGVPVRQMYGCTESPSITLNLDDDPRPTAGSVGRPLGDVRVGVYGEDGAELPPGVQGEVGVVSPVAATGYVGGALPDQRTFRGGKIFPGDLGVLDEEGHLTLVGRTKLLIEVLGRKVDPLEVEDVLVAHPAVEEAVVVGDRVGESQTEVIKAAVVVGEECTERELIRFCRDRLSSYKVPQVIEFRDAIPRSPIGKVLRKELIEWAGS